MEWTELEVFNKESEMKTFMLSLYDEYVDKLEGGKLVKKRNGDGNETGNMKRQKSTSMRGSSSKNAFVVDWTKHIGQTDATVVTHEIDQYLNDSLEPIGAKPPQETEEDDTSFDEEVVEEEYQMFDVLHWWKFASPNYPVLASIARDVFAIQVSTVASEGAFSTGGRVIDAFRSSLTPSSIEALICMQNWLKGDNIITHFEDEPCTKELEFYEAIETELANARPGSLSIHQDEEDI
ncbi:unnamed protein product [Cuscuta europaea]|uniref:HAT C-terminal dimerisation domain-containing protein n=1 Tax=Cuscuta europaea TaxID=41803 RepID=A0A9P1E058_CUSEU|nr:unnamed protein product [Cuscuta europaea]